MNLQDGWFRASLEQNREPLETRHFFWSGGWRGRRTSASSEFEQRIKSVNNVSKKLFSVFSDGNKGCGAPLINNVVGSKANIRKVKSQEKKTPKKMKCRKGWKAWPKGCFHIRWREEQREEMYRRVGRVNKRLIET